MQAHHHIQVRYIHHADIYSVQISLLPLPLPLPLPLLQIIGHNQQVPVPAPVPGLKPSPGGVIVQHHLNVLLGVDFQADGVVAGRRVVGVHVNYLAVSLVLEEESLSAVCNHLVVGGGVRGGQLGLPVIVRQVGWLGQQKLSKRHKQM